MGNIFSHCLSRKCHDTLLWSHRKEQANEINNQHTNVKYLPSTILPNNLKATSEISEAVSHAEIIVIAVPTKGIRETCQKMMQTLNKKILFVHVSKGIEPNTLKRISEIIREEIPAEYIEDIVVLSGPSHAEEVVQHHPTTVAAACENLGDAERSQDLFMNEIFPCLY